MACNASSSVGRASLPRRAAVRSPAVRRANRFSVKAAATSREVGPSVTSANPSSQWVEEEEEDLLDLHRTAATMTHRSRITFGVVGWMALLHELFSSASDA